MPNVNRKAILIAIVFAVSATLAYQKKEALFRILVVFAFAGVFVLLLLPLCALLERKGLSVSQAALCSVAALLAIVLLLVSSFIPYLAVHSIDLIRRLTPTLNGLLRDGGRALRQFGLTGIQDGNLMDMLARTMSSVTSRLAKGSVAFATQAGQFVFALVIAYYVLRERDLLAGHLLLCIPLSWRRAFLCGIRGCKNALLSYLSGVLKTSLFVGSATFAGLVLLGVRDALLLSLFMAVLEILPYIGPILASVPILLSAFSQGPTRALLALVIVVLVQQAEGNFISPHFTASSTSIHPLAALVSVFVLGSLMGMWGILLAIPLVVTARSIFWSVQQAEFLIEP